MTHTYEPGRFGDDGLCHARVGSARIRCYEPREAHNRPAPAVAPSTPSGVYSPRRARWRIERGGTQGRRLPGWFATLLAYDGVVVRCAHVPTYAAAWSVVDLHNAGEATA